MYYLDDFFFLSLLITNPFVDGFKNSVVIGRRFIEHRSFLIPIYPFCWEFRNLFPNKSINSSILCGCG